VRAVIQIAMAMTPTPNGDANDDANERDPDGSHKRQATCKEDRNAGFDHFPSLGARPG
jgi:hypothetical protein